MAAQATQVSGQFDLGQSVLAPAVQAAGEVAKIYVAGEVAKQTAKELRKSGATGTGVAVVIAVVGVIGLAAIVLITRKR